MNIPPVPTDQLIKEGDLHPHWRLFFEQLGKSLNTNLSDEGVIIPKQSTADINKIIAGDNSTSGRIIYDKETDEFKANVGGVIKSFQLV